MYSLCAIIDFFLCLLAHNHYAWCQRPCKSVSPTIMPAIVEPSSWGLGCLLDLLSLYRTSNHSTSDYMVLSRCIFVQYGIPSWIISFLSSYSRITCISTLKLIFALFFVIEISWTNRPDVQLLVAVICSLLRRGNICSCTKGQGKECALTVTCWLHLLDTASLELSKFVHFLHGTTLTVYES